MWVDRTGVKVGVTEHYSRQSKGSLALVAQEVTTRDETGAACGRGMRTTPFGQYVADGPPTCLSGARAETAWGCWLSKGRLFTPVGVWRCGGLCKLALLCSRASCCCPWSSSLSA